MPAFLSYRHESPEHAAAVRALATGLVDDGVALELDQLSLDGAPGGPDEGWPAWCMERAAQAGRVVVVASAGWYEAWERRPGSGRGAAAEAATLRERLYHQAMRNDFFRLVHLDRVVEGPEPLGSYHAFRWPADRDDLVHWLLGRPRAGATEAGRWGPAPPALPLHEVAGHASAKAALVGLMCTSAPGGLRLLAPSGLGKSTLLRALYDQAGAVPTRLADAGDPDAVLRAIAALTRLVGAPERGDDAASRLGYLLRSLADTGRAAMLMFDTWEHAPPALRKWAEGLDALPPGLRLVFAGRDLPRCGLPMLRLTPPASAEWYAWAQRRNLFLQDAPAPRAQAFARRLDAEVRRAAAEEDEGLRAAALLYVAEFAARGDDRAAAAGPEQLPLAQALRAAAMAWELDDEGLTALLPGLPIGPVKAALLEKSALRLGERGLVVHDSARRVLREAFRLEAPDDFAAWTLKLAELAGRRGSAGEGEAIYHALFAARAAPLWAAAREASRSGSAAAWAAADGAALRAEEDGVDGGGRVAVEVYRWLRRWDTTGTTDEGAGDRWWREAGDDDTRLELAAQLATVLLARGQTTAAMTWALRHRDEAQRVLEGRPGELELHRELAVAESRIGDVLQARGDLVGALRCFEAYREACRRLVAQDPSRWDWLRELAVAESRIGDVLQARGDLAGALRCFEAYRYACRRLVAQDPSARDWLRDLAVAEAKVGDVLQARGDLARALTCFEAFREAVRRLVAQDPSRRDWLRELAVAESRVGDLLQARGDLAGALRCFEAYREAARRLVAQDPSRRDWLRELAVAESKVGDVLRARGDLAGALRCFEACRDACRRLVAQDPSRRDWLRDLAVAESRVGDVLQDRGDLAGALTCFEAYREAGRLLVAQDPSRRDWLRELAVAESRVGAVLRARGDLAGALRCFEACRDAFRRLVAQDPSRWDGLRELAVALTRLGDLAAQRAGGRQEARDHWSEAAKLLREAIALAPDLSSLPRELAAVEARLR